MAWGKAKVDSADKWFSLYIRNRANWRCEKCGKKYEPPTNLLHCSHFIGRGKENTRFDPDNASAHCFHCHQYLTSHPQEHMEWKISQIGQKKVDELILKSNLYKKKDRKLEAMYWKQQVKDFKSRA